MRTCDRISTVIFPLGQLRKFRRALLDWFGDHKRDLPWRRGRDAYAIWLSEIMLQQTRVAAVLPYYEKFVARFPTVRQLAEARAEEVLRLWAGLGYYSRARNLQRAAQRIVAQHNGEFPRHHAAALSLPGVGVYTAAAVLSIAYDQPHAVLDGNVARVLARLTALRGDLRTPARWRVLQQHADAVLASRTPGNWNQAMMELGATICTPLSPKCAECPLGKWCAARRLGIADEVPSKRRKRAPLKIQIAAAVLLDSQGRTLLLKSSPLQSDALKRVVRRDVLKPGSAKSTLQKKIGAAHTDVSGLFSNMCRFPSLAIRRSARAELARHLWEIFKLDVNAHDLERLPQARHAVTFRQITLTPFLLRTADLPRASGCMSLRLMQLSEFPISNATRKIAASALKFLARNSRSTKPADDKGTDNVMTHYDRISGLPILQNGSGAH